MFLPQKISCKRMSTSPFDNTSSWNMEPTATSEFMATSMDTPIAELQDFERVVQTYWPRIFRFVLASLRDQDAAETLTQDCFWRAYRHRSRFRGDSSVNTWLVHIALNLIRDFARNRRLQFWRRTQRASVDAEAIMDWVPNRDVSPEANAVVKEQVAAVWAATKGLSERQRTVFLLRFVEDMDLLEIAAATGLTEGSVKVHLFRAVRSVRKQIGSLR
jgi:RNA polymerase sigma-70 factor (ECF subfamily)